MLNNRDFTREKIDIVNDAIDRCERFLNIGGSIVFDIDDRVKGVDLDLTKFVIHLSPIFILNANKHSIYRIIFKSVRIIYQAMEIELKSYKNLFKYYDIEKIDLWKVEHQNYHRIKNKKYDFLIDAEVFSILLMEYYFSFEYEKDKEIEERIKYFNNIFKNLLN